MPGIILEGGTFRPIFSAGMIKDTWERGIY